MTTKEDRRMHIDILDRIAERDPGAITEWAEDRDDVEVELL